MTRWQRLKSWWAYWRYGRVVVYAEWTLHDPAAAEAEVIEFPR